MKTMFCKLSVLALAFLLMLTLFSFAVNAEEITASETDTAPVTETVSDTEASDAEASDTEISESEISESEISDTEVSESETTETNADDASAMNFDFMPEQFIINLKYMAAGMVGIFLVIGVIILTILILGKLTAPKKKDEE